MSDSKLNINYGWYWYFAVAYAFVVKGFWFGILNIIFPISPMIDLIRWVISNDIINKLIKIL